MQQSFSLFIIPVTISIVYNLFWYFRFRDALEDTDFAYANYYGRKAGQAKNRRVFSEAGDFPTFKTILYYVFYISYHLSKSRIRGPRLLFAIVNTVGCIAFSMILFLLTGSHQKMVLGIVLYCTLSSAPQLGGLYLQSEFWALSFTSISLALILSGHPVAAFLAGIFMAINPLSVKPIYLFESVVLFWMAPGENFILLLAGFSMSSAAIIHIYMKDGFFTRFAYHLKDWGVFNYTLKFSRNTQSKKFWKNLTTFMPLLLTVFLPIITPALINPSAIPSEPGFLLLAGIIIIFIQFRFFRYHFLVLLPASILLFACVPITIFQLLGLIPLVYTLTFFFPKSKEDLDHRINRKILHYHTRNCVSRTIAQWIRDNTEPHDRLLVVGSSVQIYVHSDRLSIYPQLFFSPDVTFSSSNQEEILKDTLGSASPEIIVPEQNCLNWKMVEYLTKSRYKFEKSFEYNSEYFPIYRKNGQSAGVKAPNIDNLFIDCLQAHEYGSVWNPLPCEGNSDPNPTAFQSQP